MLTSTLMAPPVSVIRSIPALSRGMLVALAFLVVVLGVLAAIDDD
jgi:hypothetical protein